MNRYKNISLNLPQDAALEAMESEAARRGISIPRLLMKLYRVVSADVSLLNNVLDDEADCVGDTVVSAIRRECTVVQSLEMSDAPGFRHIVSHTKPSALRAPGMGATTSFRSPAPRGSKRSLQEILAEAVANTAKLPSQN